MSWSVQAKGSKDEVLAALRSQIASSDAAANPLPPAGQSDAENQLRKRAQALLYDAVLAHNVTQPEGYASTHTHIVAEAHGSECSDNKGNVYQSLGVTVMIHAPQADA